MLSLCIVAGVDITMCGDPAKCLCAFGNRLVFCDGPSINFPPLFYIERLLCNTLVIQNTLIYSLQQFNITQWPTLRQLNITGNVQLNCVRERERLSTQCVAMGVSLHMPCTTHSTLLPAPSTSQQSTMSLSTEIQDTSMISTGTTALTVEPSASTHWTENPVYTPTEQFSTTPGTPVNLYTPYIIILVLLICLVVAAVILLVIYIHKKRLHHPRTPIYNDVYRMTETSTVWPWTYYIRIPSTLRTFYYGRQSPCVFRGLPEVGKPLL